MARITDPKKLERIKTAAMELVAKCGYNGVSISDIAKKAEVSNGYLYRHYNSKEELMEELIESNFKLFESLFLKMIDKGETVEEIFLSFITLLFKIAKDDPVLAKFLFTIAFDQNHEVKKRREKDEEIRKLVKIILCQGLKNKEIGLKTTEEEVELVLVTIPFNYIAINLGNEEKFNDEQAKRISEICLNALK